MPPTATTPSTHNTNGNQAPNGVIMARTPTYDADRGAQRSIPAGKNRLVSVSGSGMTASFVYDGDGNRVQSTINGVTTVYIGNYYEKSGDNITKYYYAGAMRVAMKSGSGTTWLLGDHLGSTSLAVNGATGQESSEQRYMPFGEVRFGSGTLPTRYTFTGQYSYTITTSEIGLLYYGARFYDPALGRFAQADTDVPESQDVQVLDRYIYVGNNPLKHTDASGHCWGIASGLRGLPIYNTTCQNLDTALSIVQHPEANFGEKALAGGYIVLEAGAHAALAVGAAGLACAVAGPSCVTAVEGTLGIGTGVTLDGDPTNEVLAATRTAESVVDKLTRYLLNPNHPRGSTMAIWYEKALGYTQENIGNLAKQIVFDPKTAYITEVTQFGTKYNQIISITGANGKVIDIVAAWIELADGTIKLVTTIPGK